MLIYGIFNLSERFVFSFLKCIFLIPTMWRFFFLHPVRKTKAICSFCLRKENRWDYWIDLILAAPYSCSQQQSSRLFCCWCLTASPLFQFSFFSHKVMVTDSSYSVTLGSRLLLGEKYLDIAFDELLLKEELSRW